MNPGDIKDVADFILPASIISKVDLSHLVSEIERVDGSLTTAAVRAKVGSDEHAPLTLSPQLTDFLAQNNLTLDEGHVRAGLIKQVRQLKDTVPVIHLTFATAADSESLGQLAQWLRTSIHPQAVIAVGLQPGLIAGVYARTANHVHDMSLRAMLSSGRDVLVKELEALRGRS